MKTTSERKIRANRANARSSTGPATILGRDRSARNALRHALSLPVYSNPALSDTVNALASEIAGTDAEPEVLELARRVAEAQIDLRRVRDARHQLLCRALNEPCYDSEANIRDKLAVITRLLRPRAPEVPIAPVPKYLTTTPQGPDKLALILSQELQRLSAMDRYERRALSRRKFAIRAFDLAKQRKIAS